VDTSVRHPPGQTRTNVVGQPPAASRRQTTHPPVAIVNGSSAANRRSAASGTHDWLRHFGKQKTEYQPAPVIERPDHNPARPSVTATHGQ